MTDTNKNILKQDKKALNKSSVGKRIFSSFLWIIESLIIGLVLIFSYNFIGSYFNLNIPINIWTIIIISLFKLPGLVTIIVFNII